MHLYRDETLSLPDPDYKLSAHTANNYLDFEHLENDGQIWAFIIIVLIDIWWYIRHYISPTFLNIENIF